MSVSGFGSKFGVKLKLGGVGFRIWVEMWNEIEIGGGSISGFGSRFGVKLKSGARTFLLFDQKSSNRHQKNYKSVSEK